MAEPQKRPGPTAVPDDAQPSGCPVPLCPICTAVTVLGQFRPDVAEHFVNATREALLALRAVVDSRLEESEPQVDRGRVQRIDIA